MSVSSKNLGEYVVCIYYHTVGKTDLYNVYILLAN